MSGDSGDKQARIHCIDDTTKNAILNMSQASEMEYSERKRQYSAMLLGPSFSGILWFEP